MPRTNQAAAALPSASYESIVSLPRPLASSTTLDEGFTVSRKKEERVVWGGPLFTSRGKVRAARTLQLSSSSSSRPFCG
eukprot:g3788.t1